MLDEKAKKTMLLQIPHGLYICGVKDGDNLNGFTASWVMQGSFKPPLVINCVKKDSGSHEMLKKSGVFSLSFLEDGTGWPIIKDSLGYVECQVVGAVEKGDHTVCVGEVIGAGIHREGKALNLESTGWQYGG